MSNENRFLSAAMIALLAVVACGDDGGPDLSDALPERMPPVADSAARFMDPAWSGNSAEVAYVLPDLQTAVARSVAAGTRRVLFQVTTPAQILAVELSADGSEAFTTSYERGSPGHVVRRHSAAGVELITNSGRAALGEEGAGVRVAANGSFAYVVRPDSVFIRRTTGSAAEFLGAGCPRIAAISPVGEGVICFSTRLGAPPPPLRYTSSAAEPTPIIGTSVYFVIEVAWNSEGIYLASVPQESSLHGFAVERYLEPASRYVTPNHPSGEFSFFRGVALSANGRSLAYVTDKCLGCKRSQMMLYIADRQNRTSNLFGVHWNGSLEAISVSPDGSKVAYVNHGRLYIASP